MAFENIEDLESTFINQKLKSIKLYNVNDNYFVFDPKSHAVIDGGVEFIFEEEILSIAWNMDVEHFDVHPTVLKPLINEVDYYEIDSADIPFVQDIFDSRLQSINAKWGWYFNLNDELEPIGEKQYFPFEVIFSFENGRQFQIAMVAFDIENKKMCNVKFDVGGQLLLALDGIHEIESQESTDFNTFFSN